MAVPAVIPASVAFYYREEGLWGTMMAQLSLVSYASDFVSGLIIRGLGTVAGESSAWLCGILVLVWAQATHMD